MELMPYSTETNSESDSEQYHEIDQDVLVEETTFSSSPSTKHINAYDFFTQHDVNHKKNRKEKRKKVKNKKPSSIMDIINTELASEIPLIRENVIELINHDKVQTAYCKSSTGEMLKWHDLDIERGRRFIHPVKLSPMFPKVFENTSAKELQVGVHYSEPVMFNALIAGYTSAEGSIQRHKFLDFEIQNMKFTHHYKFSLETLLVVKLIDCHNEYLYIQKTLKEICRNIKISRETKNNLKLQLLEISASNKEGVRFDATLLKYTATLFYYKDAYIEMLKKRKETVHKILSLWSDVEMVREKSNRTEVNYFLEINKVPIPDDVYLQEWNDVFEVEYLDMLDQIEYEYANEYIKYKETKSRSHASGSEKKTITRPKLVIDEARIRTDTEKLVDNILEKNKIDIILKCKKHSTKDLLKPVHALGTIDYYFKIFVDEVFVCQSEVYTCKDFIYCLDISETFSVQILPNNSNIFIVLYENDSKVSSIDLTIEEFKESIVLADIKAFTFIYSDRPVHPCKKYVGSGYGIKEIAAENKVRLKSGNLFEGKLTTACDVNMKIGWNKKMNDNNHEAVLASIQTERQIKRFLNGIDKPDVDNLIQIINNLYDTHVESDENIINTLTTICRTGIKQDYTFASEASDQRARLNLLHLRNKGGFTNIEKKMVPLLPSQISTNQLSALRSTDRKLIDVHNFEDSDVIDPIDLQRYLGVKYIQELNENLQRTVNEFLLQKTHRDVVKDFKDLSLRGILSSQTNLMSLSVSSFVTRNQLLTECSTREHEVRATVSRAFNLPDRALHSLTETEEDDERIAGFKVRPLRPYVRLSYHGISSQTAPGVGCYPSWNQTLNIRTKFSPLSSINVNVYDEYKISVRPVEAGGGGDAQCRLCSRWLGKLVVPLSAVLTSGTLRGTFKLTTPPSLMGYEYTTAKETRSLIPQVRRMIQKDISFLTLQITTSLSHLGDAQTYAQPAPHVSNDDQTIDHLNNFITEYLNEFPSRSISLTYVDSSGKNKCVTEFLQPIPAPDLDWFPKNPKTRSESALSKSSSHSKSSSSKSSGKKNSATFSPLKEEKVNVYSGIDLPSWRSEDNQLSKAVNLCVRYVSLIPTYEVSGPQAITLTGLELLRVLNGSPADHTILLAGYFLHLGLKCCIVTGVGLPRGLSTYLLVKYDLITRRYTTLEDQAYKSRGLFRKSDDFAWHVFDAVSGEQFELRDVACPLKTVLFVYDEENIWVNIQSSLDCQGVSFDFSKSSDWRQVFENSRPMERQAPETVTSVYSAPGDVDRLRETLESKIVAKVQKWRPRNKTVWNRYCSTLLSETLPQWEYWSFNTTEPRPEPGHRLKQLMVSYKMFGFPLNTVYVNTRSVLADVKATGLHLNEDPDVEFSLAVQLYAYPNNVISVKDISVCSLFRRLFSVKAYIIISKQNSTEEQYKIYSLNVIEESYKTKKLI